MKIIFDEVGSVKISHMRFNQLKKAFDKNYKNIARSVFRNMDSNLQLELLNDEFHYDKQIIALTGNKHSSFLSKAIEQRDAYLYTPSYNNLGASPNAQTHIRHNAYRTISAMLLDASFEEKVAVLSHSITSLHFKNKDILNIASFRLNSLIERLYNNEANISQ